MECEQTALGEYVCSKIKKIDELEADIAALSKTNRQLIQEATHGINKADVIREMIKEVLKDSNSYETAGDLAARMWNYMDNWEKNDEPDGKISR